MSLDHAAVTERLRPIYESVLGRPVTDPQAGLRNLGGDSIILIRILSEVMDAFGVTPSAGDPDASHSLAAMAELIVEQLATLPLEEAQEPRSEPTLPQAGTLVPLLANRLSYMARRKRGLLEWTIATPMLRLLTPGQPAALEAAFEKLLARHDSLRLRLEPDTSDGIVQRLKAPRLEETVRRAVLPAFASEQERREHLEGLLRAAEQSLEWGGPLIRLIVCTEEGAQEASAFALVVHHVCADALGFGRLVQEFLREYEAASRAETAHADAPRFDYLEYTSAVLSHQAAVANQARDYWLSLPWERTRPLLPGADSEHPLNIEAHSVVSKVSGRPAPVEAGSATDAEHGSLAARVVAAIATAYRDWTGADVLLLDMLFHGREAFGPNIDASRMVAWLSETRPLVIDTRLEGAALLAEAQRQLAWVGSRGASHGYLRHIAPDERLTRLPRPELSLNLLAPSLPSRNYLGLCAPVWPRPSNSPPPPDAQRAYLLSAGCFVGESGLEITWDYSSKLFSGAQVDKFTARCAEALAAFSVAEAA